MTGTPSITWNPPATIQYGAALSDVELNATASVPGNFVYSPTAGTVLQAGSQKLTVTFTPSDTVTYGPVTSNVELTVTQATPVITWAPLSPILQGTALGAAQLNATANVPGTLSYSPALGTVLPAGTQQLTATFTPSDTTDYKPITAHDSLTITAATSSAPTITWNTPAPIQYGAALSNVQLNATASVPGNFIYSPAAGAVLQAGSQKLTAIFTPADTTNYSAVTATVQLTVTQAASVVTWAALSPIHQGTALSGAQLNATANVPGTFSYSPAAGTVLPAGTQQLIVTFTPSNATDYTSATALNSLTVNAGSTAEPTPVNGACGPANGTTSSVAPSAGSLQRRHSLGGHGDRPVDLAMHRQQRRNHFKLHGFVSGPGRSFHLSAKSRDQYSPRLSRDALLRPAAERNLGSAISRHQHHPRSAARLHPRSDNDSCE